MRSKWLIALFLVVVTAAIYAPVAGFDFISLDDPGYVRDNPIVRDGISVEGIRWASTTFHKANWHPLTWLSHMLDVEFFGDGASAQHVHNLILHLANTVILFLLLYAGTKHLFRSAWIAALFALHPMHVESVAWIAERKDVLSTFWGLLSVAAYGVYVRSRSKGWFGAALATFAMSLLAKPMLVTLPFVLLLLDSWPLRRDDPWRLRLVEKLPFLALAVASSAMTVLAQALGGAVASLEGLPLGERIATVSISYAQYLGKLFWPSDLVVFYPFASPTTLQSVGALALLAALLLLAIRLGKSAVLVGWLLFLGTLVPVIGLVRVGTQAIADRYTYLPSVGLFIAVAWLLPSAGRARWASATIALATVAVCALATVPQIRHWRDTITLFEHAVDVDPGNHRAQFNLALGHLRAGNREFAGAHFSEAARLRPNWYEPSLALGALLRERGEFTAAIEQLERAVAAAPQVARPHYVLGLTQLQAGQVELAIDHLGRATELDDGDARAPALHARALVMAGRSAEALSSYEEALARDPLDTATRNDYGLVLGQLGRQDEAIAQLERVLELDPANQLARENLARVRSSGP